MLGFGRIIESANDYSAMVLYALGKKNVKHKAARVHERKTYQQNNKQINKETQASRLAAKQLLFVERHRISPGMCMRNRGKREIAGRVEGA